MKPADARATAAIQAVVEHSATVCEAIAHEMSRVLVGQPRLVNRLLIGLVAGGHVVLEGLPGLAKTMAVKAFASATGLQFQRIQFTSDLLPSDLVGTLVYSPRDGTFHTHKGPVFANVVLADEINRAPAKVQSALLQAMQERAVTIGTTTYPLDEPFFVLPTQNPIEHEGTYPLPEAQLDRFLLYVRVNYPARADEVEILRRQLQETTADTRPVMVRGDLESIRGAAACIHVDDRLITYVLDLVRATRAPGEMGLADLAGAIRYGVSPRGACHLMRAARAHALLSRRGHVLPEDVHEVFFDALRHRVLLTYDAQADNRTSDEILDTILRGVRLP